MKQSIISALIFLRVIDAHDNMLSLTNVAVIVMVVKLAVAPVATITDLGALFVTVSNYAYKKYVNKDAGETVESPVDAQIAELTKKFEQTESIVAGLSISQGIKKLT